MKQFRTWTRPPQKPQTVETDIIMPEGTPAEIIQYVKDLDKALRERSLIFPHGVLVSAYGFPQIPEGLEGLLFFPAPEGLDSAFRLLTALPGSVDVIRFKTEIEKILPTLNADSYLLVLVCAGQGVYLMHNRKVSVPKGDNGIIH